MEKIRFDTDYMAGAHEEIMACLLATNLEKTVGYGGDDYTAAARAAVREACAAPDAGVYFLVGGTQTNATVIDALLERCEGVLAAETGHINVHEAGAIEASGHKVLTLPQHDGKVAADDLQHWLEEFYGDETWPHMVLPGALYLSHPTEYGTLYTLDELRTLRGLCDRYGLRMFVDGARLAYGLAADGSDVGLPDLAALTDAFYIGGTKCGALFGEAVVLRNPSAHPHFFTLIKRHGALLAKGRLLGVQFETLFTNDLYGRIGRHALRQAAALRAMFLAKGFRTYIDSPTNQQFFVLPNRVIDRLAEEVGFELWGARGAEESVVRFVTSWATTDAEMAALQAALARCE